MSTSPIYWNFEDLQRIPVIVTPPNLTDSKWKKKYFALMEGCQAVFLIQADFTPERKNMPFWLIVIVAISKSVKDPNLPFTCEEFV